VDDLYNLLGLMSIVGVWIVLIISWMINLLLLAVMAFLMFDGGFREMSEIRTRKDALQEKGEKRRKFKIVKVKDED